MSNNVPDFQKIMYPVLCYLKDEQPHPIIDVMNGMAAEFKLTEEDLRVKVPSGQMSLFKNRVAWAISYLKNAGLIYYPQRAVYQIATPGKKVLTENIKYINIAYLKRFPDYQKWQNTFAQSDEPDKIQVASIEEKTPEEILGATYKELKNKLSYDLLEFLKNKPASYFEYFVLQLLIKMGYGGVEEDNFEVTGKSGDDGIDGVIYQDKLGLDRIYVQAKRWKDTKVQSKEIRDFIGSLSLKGTNRGVFITTSEFTEDALRTVKMNPQNRIILIGGQQLTEYAIDHNVGVQVKKVYEVKDIDNDFFEEV